MFWTSDKVLANLGQEMFPTEPDRVTGSDMTPFMLIQDGRRLTLQLCEMPQERFTWFVFAADCGKSGFGPDRVIAQSAELARGPDARKAAMAAFLEQKQYISSRPAASAPRLDDAPDAHIAAPAARSGLDVDQLMQDVRTRLSELRDVLDLIHVRVSGPPAPVTADSPARHSHSADAVSTAWRLMERRFLLLSPEGVDITLSVTEHRLLIVLFRAAGANVPFAQAQIAVAGGADKKEVSKSSVSVLVNRLRAKVRKRGMDLPLHTVRGTGYHFGASAILGAGSGPGAELAAPG